MAERDDQSTLTESPVTPPKQVPENKARPVAPRKVAIPPVPSMDPESSDDVLIIRAVDELANIPSTQEIGQLILSGDHFANRSLKQLAGLTIPSLSIEAIGVSNAGLQYLTQVRGIRRLRLWSPGIDDDALAWVAELSDLEVLDLEGTAIAGSEFAQLKDLAQLEWLILGPQLSDATLAQLSPLKSLRQLDLRACRRLTLAGLESLANLAELKVVWLPQHLRTKGKRALRLTLPECQVRS